MNNKNNILIGVGAVVVILVVIGGFMFFSNKSPEPAPIQKAPVEEEVMMMEPEEIGLDLSLSSDEREAILEIANTDGIESIDYELSYVSKGEIPRGVIGRVDIVSPGDAISQEITLGTCSDVCHYDEDISDIKLVLKVVKTDGTTSQVEKTL